MSTQALPVALGTDRQHASQVFGQSFDRLLLTNYVELAGGATGFVGVAADPDMRPGLDWALGLLAQDPGLELAVELPRDAALAADVSTWLAGAQVRVVGVRRFGDHPCVVLAAGADPTTRERIAELLGAAVRQGHALDAPLDEERSRWELAAHKERSDTLERQIRDVRVQLARKRGEARDLHLMLERHGVLPDPARADQHRAALLEIGDDGGGATPARAPAPGRLDQLSLVLGATGRRGRTLTLALLAAAGVVGLAALVVVVVLLVGGGAVRVGLALALVVLLVLVGVAVSSARRAGAALGASRRTETVLVERLGAIEQLQAGLASALVELPGRLPAPVGEPDLAPIGDRLQLTATLYALAPPAADVPVLPTTTLRLTLAAVAAVLERRPSLVVVTGAPDVALFVALAAGRHNLDTRVVALDDDAPRARALTERAARHGVTDRLESRYAPLARTGIEGHRTAWYAAPAWSDLDRVDLAVVAGPDDALGPRARLPFVPLLGDRLAPGCTLLLPDAASDVLEAWSAVLPTAALTDAGPGIVALRH